MNRHKRLDDRFTIGLGAPSSDELRELAQQHYSAVVDFRCDDESKPMPPLVEGRLVKALGMRYVHMPMKDLEPRAVDHLSDALRRIDGRVFVHCSSGKRAAAMTTLYLAAEHRLSPEAAATKAQEYGVDETVIYDFMAERRP